MLRECVKRKNLRREKIPALLIQAYTNKEIAAQLGVKPRTIKQDIAALFREHNITSGFKRVKLVVILYRKSKEKARGAHA